MSSNIVYDTIIVSDGHLSDAEPHNPKKPLWKKFKAKDFFIDQDFSDFLDNILLQNAASSTNPIELVFNGDWFDFDSVMSIPDKEQFNFKLNPYELKFGLNSKEDKSVYKIDTILKQHEIWTNSVSNFIKKGNKVIFIIGNHDIELHWEKVQKKLIEHLKLSKEESKRVIFCEWFYISNKDTLIEHGNQYDPYCMAIDPINPVVKKNGEYRIRLPFGNLANRFMINAMGFKNPHNDDSYVKTFKEFIKFFFKYEMKDQPLLVIDWLVGAIKTLFYSIGESFLPRVKDPLTYTSKLNKIAKKSNSNKDTILELRENHAHSAVYNPWTIIRELWLDRAFLLALLIILSWQFFSFIAVFISISFYWFFLPLGILLPFFGYYANGVVGGSEIRTNQNQAKEMSILSAKVCKVNRVVLGHTHSVYRYKNKKYEVLNTGTWSVFFDDIECTKKNYLFTFVWIFSNGTNHRVANIYKYDKNKITIYNP